MNNLKPDKPRDLKSVATYLTAIASQDPNSVYRFFYFLDFPWDFNFLQIIIFMNFYKLGTGNIEIFYFNYYFYHFFPRN